MSVNKQIYFLLLDENLKISLDYNSGFSWFSNTGLFIVFFFKGSVGLLS